MQQSVTIEFKKIAGAGNALGYCDGRACFVPGGLPDETARVCLTQVKPRFATGHIEELITPSPHRRPPSEAHYLACSPWQGVEYNYQLELKRAMVSELMGRPELALSVDGIVAAPQLLQYRNKLTFRLLAGAGDIWGLAVNERQEHDQLLPTPDGCVLGMRLINDTARQLARLLGELRLASEVDSVTLRQNQAGSAVAAVMQLKPGARFNPAAPWHRLVEAAGLTGAAVRLAGAPGGLAWTAGRQTLPETVHGVALAYPITSFFQTNLPAFEQALADILQAIPAGTRLVDLYGGAGVIGLAAAARAKSVAGIEVDARAAAQAEANAVAARITNYTAYAAAAEQIEPALLADAGCVVVDPPRAGLTAQTVQLLRTAAAPRIIYLSCNPATQARDLMRLSADYTISPVKAYDFYPGTLHVETLAVLNRRP